LDVLNVAEPIPCYLNRQIIIILSSLGIPDSAFSNLQDSFLRSISEILVDNQGAQDAIQKYFRSVYSFSQGRNNPMFNYTQDAFFHDLLKTIYQKSLIDLVQKSRIPVTKGRILMGTIDEFGVLEKDQVFVQCRSLEGEKKYLDAVKWYADGKFVVKSKVIVAKNPCMHPGDVRVMKAVDVPELKHMFDCIVFPSVGPRPIASMCSGRNKFQILK
jgi:RNA-dependent RNA polymerase